MRSTRPVLAAALSTSLPATLAAHDGGHYSAGVPGDAKKPARIIEVVMREDDGRMQYVPSRLDDIETETLNAMMTGDEHAFAAMPEPMRALINESYLLPTQGWHQMFGTGVDIQGNAAVENEGNVMLLQLVYDDMIAWRFGDMGAFQFWIPPEELALGRWKAARVTFEMG